MLVCYFENGVCLENLHLFCVVSLKSVLLLLFCNLFYVWIRLLHQLRNQRLEMAYMQPFSLHVTHRGNGNVHAASMIQFFGYDIINTYTKYLG